MFAVTLACFPKAAAAENSHVEIDLNYSIITPLWSLHCNGYPLICQKSTRIDIK